MDLIINGKSSNPTLCLNMIVKNESKIITRLFDSVVSIIDSYCICDTGSTDNTIDVIKEYFKDKNIPGKIVIEPFKDFCYNRNFALNECLNMSDYILLLDADMILEIKNFDKNILNTADTFTILQGNENFYYQNVRILKNNGLFSYTGVTHEYINTPSNNITYSIEKNNLFIKDVGDGGSKVDKFERDIKLLLNGIKDEPNNVRYYFYLANSYHDSGRFGESINCYKKRIELGGWLEEIWFSYYRIGLCYKNMGKIENAIFSWMEGYEIYPERLEGLYEILQYYRLSSKHKLGEIIYKLAKNILDKNLNRDNYLFLHNDIYTSKIYYEYSVIASYLGKNNINDEIIKILNNSKDESNNFNLLNNMKFYKDIIKSTKKIILDNSFFSEVFNESIKFTSSSSCLIPNPCNSTGYFLNIRYVNYTIDKTGCYHNCEKNIVSINKFLELNNNFNILIEKPFTISTENRRYIGIEDLKFYKDEKNNDLLFIGTGYHQNNKIGIVHGNYNLNNLQLNEKEVNTNFSNNDCEKNWVFVNYENSTHIIYNWFPINICKMNKDLNKIFSVCKKDTPLLFSKIRGSTNGFKYNNIPNNSDNNISLNLIEEEIWFVNHIVSYEEPRHYYHIISIFDKDMNLLRYSAPFKFEGEPIEYCLSIIVEKERVLINYSTWDRTTRIGIYDKKYIDSIVKYS